MIELAIAVRACEEVKMDLNRDSSQFTLLTEEKGGRERKGKRLLFSPSSSFSPRAIASFGELQSALPRNVKARKSSLNIQGVF